MIHFSILPIDIRFSYCIFYCYVFVSILQQEKPIGSILRFSRFGFVRYLDSLTITRMFIRHDLANFHNNVRDLFSPLFSQRVLRHINLCSLPIQSIYQNHRLFPTYCISTFCGLLKKMMLWEVHPCPDVDIDERDKAGYWSNVYCSMAAAGFHQYSNTPD